MTEPTRLVSVPEPGERRDKRGRRIGYNWWREYNCQMLYDYNAAVESHREDNHQMEPDEYSAARPLLTLKQCLVGNAGMSQPTEEDEAA